MTGSHVETACRAVGIERMTFYRWLKDKTKTDITYTIIKKSILTFLTLKIEKEIFMKLIKNNLFCLIVLAVLFF